VSHRLTRRFLGYLNRKSSRTGEARILTDIHGITLVTAPESFSAGWARVTRIVAFKRDVYSHDLLCILIELEGANTIEVNESMPGWTEMIEQLPIYLPEASPWRDWYPKAAFPAFDVAPTPIFVRQKTD
jgi:hypothetical protein